MIKSLADRIQELKAQRLEESAKCVKLLGPAWEAIRTYPHTELRSVTSTWNGTRTGGAEIVIYDASSNELVRIALFAPKFSSASIYNCKAELMGTVDPSDDDRLIDAVARLLDKQLG